MAATAMEGATAMVVMAVATMARGLLMPSLRLRLSLDTVMSVDTDTVATAAAMVVMAAMAVATTARGLLMPSLRLMPLPRLSLAMATTAVDMAAMAVAMVVMVAMAVATTARGRLRLSPATATAVDTVA